MILRGLSLLLQSCWLADRTSEREKDGGGWRGGGLRRGKRNCVFLEGGWAGGEVTE